MVFKEISQHLVYSVKRERLFSAYKYTVRTQEILKKIDFTMGDSTAHNLGVMEKVCEDEGLETAPSVVLCNVHPLMMFQRKIKEFCQVIKREWALWMRMIG